MPFYEIGESNLAPKYTHDCTEFYAHADAITAVTGSDDHYNDAAGRYIQQLAAVEGPAQEHALAILRIQADWARVEALADQHTVGELAAQLREAEAQVDIIREARDCAIRVAARFGRTAYSLAPEAGISKQAVAKILARG